MGEASLRRRSAGQALRRKVFLAYAGFSTVSIGLIVLALVASGKPLDPATLLCAVGLLIYPSGYAWVRRGGRPEGPAAVCIGWSMLMCFILERVTDADPATLHVALMLTSVALVFLAGARYGFLGFALVSADAYLFIDWTRSSTPLVDWLGYAVCGFIVVVLTAVFERERQRQSALAEHREQRLEAALERAEAATERAEAATARAESAASARFDFLANMSHEIRTPMNGVLGLSRVLIEEGLPPAQAELAQTILDSGEGLMRILDDVLDLSKLEAGALLVEARPTDVSRLAQDIGGLMRGRASERGLSLGVKVDASVPAFVDVDGHRLRQVLGNLVGNAIKFTESGRVDLELSHAGGRLSCRVEDTGIGMDPSTLERIFDPFAQAEAGTARRFGGTGLGLSISRRLAELMDGQIRVTSALGRGSCFVLEVQAPMCAAPAVAAAKPEEAIALDVLVAEDVQVNQLVIRRMLERLGMRVTVVEDGASAVTAASEGGYDAVLMDVHMPVMDGIAAARRIRALDGPPGRVPIFALTASVMKQERDACLAAGMDDVLAKPIDSELLIGRLRGAARERED